MGGDTQQQTDGGTHGGAGNGTDDKGAQGADKADPAQTGQLEALKAERAARQTAEAKLAKIGAEAAAAEVKRLEAAGEHKRLYEAEAARSARLQADYDAAVKRETARLERLAARNTERTAALPEHIRDLVPAGLDADAIGDWLDRASKVADPARPAGGRSATGGRPTIPPECIAAATQIGEDPETYHPIWLQTAAGRRWAAKQKT